MSVKMGHLNGNFRVALLIRIRKQLSNLKLINFDVNNILKCIQIFFIESIIINVKFYIEKSISN